MNTVYDKNNKKKSLVTKKKKKRKIFGFTLIELLAVIIILGVLMIIAIPSVTEYISSSRKNAYVTTAGQYISGARNKVNAAEIPMFNTEATYYIPTSCISLEKGGGSPFGDIEEGYVVVTYDGYGYDYYFTVRDSSNQGILLTDDDLLSIERVETGITDINELIGIEGREVILISEDCKESFTEHVAVDTIPENGKLESNVIPTPTPDPEPTPEPDPDDIPISASVRVNRGYKSTTADISIANVNTNEYPLQIDYYIKLASADDSTYVKKASQTVLSGSTDSYTYNDIETYESYMLKIVIKDALGGEYVLINTAGTYCFLAGTQVLTENGLVNIEDIKIGDFVYSINMDTNNRELKQVTSLFSGQTNEVYEITIGDEVVKTTPKHEFYIVDKGWIRAYELEIGDEIVSTGDEKMIIKKIVHKTNQELTPVYNLTVDGNHTYLITKYSLLVHNAGSK